MKALIANLSVKREAWDRVKSTILRHHDHVHGIAIEPTELQEPAIASPQWVKVRSIMSGISDMEEGMILHQNAAPLGAFISFPFVPGNENVGIVTEIGREVEGVELGQRVVVDPLLACTQRQVDPPCPLCSRGEPHCCRNFDKGVVGPGMMIGACADTGGGWGDSFIAHQSQLHRLPDSMETEHAVLALELARAVKAVLQNSPSPGDRVIITGSGSLGLLVVLVLEMLGYEVSLMVVAEHPFEVAIARRVTGASVVLAEASGTVYEEVAEFVGGSVRYPRIGPMTLEGGADLVYETTGRRDFMEDGLRFAGEGKRLILVGMKEARALDLVPVWRKGVKILGPGWSRREFFDGTMTDVMDIALALMERHSLPVADFLTHRFTLAQYHQAFSTLENRLATRAMKVIFHHVV